MRGAILMLLAALAGTGYYAYSEHERAADLQRERDKFERSADYSEQSLQNFLTADMIRRQREVIEKEQAKR